MQCLSIFQHFQSLQIYRNKTRNEMSIEDRQCKVDGTVWGQPCYYKDGLSSTFIAFMLNLYVRGDLLMIKNTLKQDVCSLNYVILQQLVVSDHSTQIYSVNLIFSRCLSPLRQGIVRLSEISLTLTNISFASHHSSVCCCQFAKCHESTTVGSRQ